MNKTKIIDMFENKGASDFSSMVLNGQWTNDEGILISYPLITPNEWLFDCKYKYGEKYFLYYGNQPFSSFKSLFSNWVVHNQQSVNILTRALYTRYNPLENYDKYSEIKTEYDGAEKTEMLKGSTSTTTEEGWEKNELKRSGKEKTTNHIGSVDSHSTNSSSPYDGVDSSGEPIWKGTDKTDTTTNQLDNDTSTVEYGAENSVRSDENMRTFSDDRATKVTGSGKDTDTKSFIDREDTVTEHTHGNIGVLTPAGMISQELQIRLKDLSSRLMETFINEYCTIMED